MLVSCRAVIVTATALAFTTILSGTARADTGSGGLGTTGIAVTSSTLQPTPDPTFEYVFSLVLQPGTQLDSGNYITFKSVPDVIGTSIQSPFGSDFQTFQTADGSGSDVKFSYVGSTPLTDSGSSLISLGNFIIITGDDYDPNNIPPALLNPITVLTQTSTTGNSNNAIVSYSVTASVVPEPASLVMVSLGVLGAGWVAVRRKLAHG
jgi:hypothetical protein